MIEQFHLIRPLWLLALIPLCVFAWLLLRNRLFSRSWQSVIDPALLPHLLIGKPGKASNIPLSIFLLAGLLAIIALAGPAWEKRPQPVFRETSALVIALDLSRSMDATDIKPSRLGRARYKISDILKQRKEGQTALIAYAAEAFTVTPLTDDAATIDALVPSLTTNIMPAQGSNTVSALNLAKTLLKNAGVNKGDILLLTDDIEDTAKPVIEQLGKQGYRVSILAVGTEEGAPIPAGNGGFVKNANGAIVIPKLSTAQLKSMATAGGGRFSRLSAADDDIKYILDLFKTSRSKTDTAETEMKTDVWREQGPWLLLVLMPLAALAFRKGYLAVAFVFIMPWPQPANALSWDELWRNDNQRALQQFEAGKPAEAAELFNSPEWKASAYYKAGEFEQAVEQLQNINTADAHYNRGNALAKLGRIEDAIDAYNKALELDSTLEDAKYNRELLEKQQQQENKNQNSEQNKNQQGNEQQKSDQQSQDGSEQQDASQQQQSEKKQDAADNSQKNEHSDNESQQEQKTQAEQQQDEQQQQQAQQASTQDAEQELSAQEQQQWLKRIPDDPGGLLRNKFRYQYKRQGYQSDANKPW